MLRPIPVPYNTLKIRLDAHMYSIHVHKKQEDLTKEVPLIMATIRVFGGPLHTYIDNNFSNHKQIIYIFFKLF